MITEMHWWVKAKQENYHLKQANGEQEGAHRAAQEYNSDEMKERIANIVSLFRGNEAQVFRFIVERTKKSATVCKNTISENEKYRLHFIARNYFDIQEQNEINKIDDDVLYALFVDVSNNPQEVGHYLSILKGIQLYPEAKLLACMRWAAVEFLYEVIIEAFEMSKAADFKKFMGIPVDSGPLASSAFGVGIYHAVYKLASVMPTWGAILLTSGLSTLGTIVSYSYQYFKIHGQCHGSRQGGYELIARPEADFLTSRARPLTHPEKTALAKRFGWKVTALFTIYLASIKIAIQNYTDDSVDEFFSKYTGDILPPGSLDYVILMLAHTITKSALHHLNIRSDQ